jgi:hypothetical protein
MHCKVTSGTEINGRPLAHGDWNLAGRLNNTSKEPSWRLIILYFPVASLTFEASCLQYDHVKYHKHFTGSYFIKSGLNLNMTYI